MPVIHKGQIAFLSQRVMGGEQGINPGKEIFKCGIGRQSKFLGWTDKGNAVGNTSLNALNHASMTHGVEGADRIAW